METFPSYVADISLLLSFNHDLVSFLFLNYNIIHGKGYLSAEMKT